MRLNIIGNGFDLYHGLPSSYYYYACYLIEKDLEFYLELGEMYSIKTMVPIGSAICHDFEYAIENLFWSDFENKLGTVDEYYVVDTNDYDLGLENDYPIEIEMNQHKNAETIKEYFMEWVETTLDDDENYSLIKEYFIRESDRLEQIKFNDKDRFVTFNYTHTLQNVYDIADNKIHYIHGECNGYDELVIGHGNDNRIEEISKKIDKIKSEYTYTQSELNAINEHICILTYLEKTRKNVSYCKSMLNSFYKTNCNNVEAIRVIGLSFGEVDMPYLIDIRERFSNAKWEISFYSDDDRKRINKIAINDLKLRLNEYTLFELANPVSNIIKAEIIRLRNINTI